MWQTNALTMMASVAIAVGLGASPMAQAATMYAVGFNATNSPVYRIDTVTGAATTLGGSGIGRLNSLAATPSGTLYSVGGPTQGNQNHLVSINPTTGAGTDLGSVTFDIAPPASTFNGIIGLAADQSGSLYASLVTFSGPQQSLLYRINPSTLTATQVSASMGAGSISGLEFSSNGTLYGMSDSSLYQINTTTGAATLVGTGTSPAVQSLAFDPDGSLWAVDGFPGAPSRFFTVDPLTGSKTLMFTGASGSVLDLRGIEFLAPVPVPAALWLFGSGLAALVGFARCKTVTQTTDL